MSAEDYEQVILPKVQGSWNLHEQLSKLKLDFFVMLASAVSVSGNLGQSNYAAASSFQDALSHYRAAKGLPAVAIDLGMIFGAGFVSKNEWARENLKRQGYADIHLEELMAILQSATTRSAGDQACQIITGLYTPDILDSKLGQSLSDSSIPLWFRDLKFSHLLSKSAVKIGESTDTSVLFHLSMERAKTLTEASEVVCEAITAKLSKSLVIPKDDIHSDRPIAAYGIDSLVAVELRNWMLREIKADIPLFEILGNAPLLLLSRKVATKSKLLSAALLNEDITQSNSGDSAEESRVQKMQALVEKYSKDLPLARHLPVRDDRWTVILTGSTGSLGSYLLESLLAHPKVVKVICLNRSARGQQGQVDINAVRGLTTDLAAYRVEFYQVDLGERQLALAPDKYGMLLSSVTHIIHNAWQVDFISSIESFEHSHIRGVRHLIEFSVASKKTAGIYFVSSIAAVTNWLERHSGNVPEKIIRDYSVASPIGYGESKYVAERLLDLASARSGVPVTIIRVGQVAGPIQKQGMWNKREWLPSLISSSKYLGLLPETLGVFGTVDWIPVDFVSEILIGLVESSDIKPPVTARVYHVVNPHTTSWKSLLPTVQAYFNRKQRNIEIVPFTVWVGALQGSALAASVNTMSNPALNLLEVYQLQTTEGLAEIAPLEVQQTVAASTGLEALEAVGAQWMTIWLQQWDF